MLLSPPFLPPPPPLPLSLYFLPKDNAGVFRDIKRVGYRRVLESRPGWKRVEVEQCGELKVWRGGGCGE
jgi:hypothetical protein